MTILCVGDIQWELENVSLVKTPEREFEERVEERDILSELKSEIDDASPSLMLFAGDVINDGGNSEEHVEEFLDVLHYLEQREIPSFTIHGNHDEYSNYETVEEEIAELTYAEEISQKVAEFDGSTVVGIPYDYTHSLRSVREIGEDFPDSYDVLLAHAERSRRVWLFEVDADIIITGHFATELFQHRDQLFVSMNSYPANSVVIEPEQKTVTYRQFVSDAAGEEREMYTTTVKPTEHGLEFISNQSDADAFGLRDLGSSQYSDLVSNLRSGKEQVEAVSEEEEEEIIKDLLASDVPKTHIQEYIGRYRFQ